MIYHSGVKLKLNKKGFTLIEMVTSISLIVIITAVFAANYRSSNKRTDLIMTAQTLVGNFHAAQNNTLGLVKYGDEVPAGGWGIHLDLANPHQYILFADLDRPASDEPGNVHEADIGYAQYNEEDEGEIDFGARQVYLPAGLEISSLKADSGTSFNSVDITFLPPDPRTYIVVDGGNFLEAIQITLRDPRENTTKIVRVNFLGLAEVVGDDFEKFSF
ncbi:prepilin-type N-terminal cleavage/methylation domain-containing protein [Candidatus Falkowbacteria bacterium]|jgi:prepilin-type N-terminal cleavage/methylation domain-containing protein|nr:prepilin-type N-terminal cleavage/methylation domain-containing protein [Candidatus Falkowbacteria bacterium]